MANDRATGKTSGIYQLDHDWQRQREQFLDWGREPQALTLVDVAITVLFFVFNWAAATWLGHNEYTIGAAVIAIAVLFSFRSRAFDSAYRTYLSARARTSQFAHAG